MKPIQIQIPGINGILYFDNMDGTLPLQIDRKQYR